MRHGVSNHQHLDSLLSCLFRRTSKKTSKLHVTDFCEGNPPVTSGFPHKRPVTRKMWRHHEKCWPIYVDCWFVTKIVIWSNAKWSCNSEFVIFKYILAIDRLCRCRETSIKWTPEELTDDKSRVAQAMVWCRQALTRTDVDGDLWRHW